MKKRFSPRGTYVVFSNNVKKKEKIEMRVIIVEDDKGIRESLKDFLTVYLNAEVLTFADPSCALAAMEVFKPHVAILDYMLPDMDGIELTKKIKQKSPYCYVAMISGTENVFVIVNAMRAGCDNFIKKPFQLDAVGACLTEATYMAHNVKSLDEIESDHIENVVATSDTLENAAKKLDINVSTLWRKRKKDLKAA